MTDQPASTAPKGITKEQIAAALEKNGGVHAYAAQALGCSRRNISARVANDPDLQRVAEDADATVSDMAEAAVIAGIKAKDRKLATWWLERRRRDRFSPRTEHTGKDGAPLFDPAALALLTDDELEFLDGIRKRLSEGAETGG